MGTQDRSERRARARAAAWATTALVVTAVGTLYARAPVDQKTTEGSLSPSDRALVKQYCAGCHNARTKTAALELDRDELMGADGITAHPDVWERVTKKLRSGAMPPAGAPRPEPRVLASFITDVEGALDRAAAAHPNPGRVPAVHRLNRAEYANAVRDLLALPVDATTLLPPDDSGYGFDNIADVLSISPMLTERYLAAASKISRIAVGNADIRPVTDTFVAHKLFRQDDRVSEDLPFGSRGGISIPYYFPVDGNYLLKLFFLRVNVGPIRGLGEPHQLEVRLDGRLVHQATIGGAAPDAAAGAVPGAARRGNRAAEEEFDGMEVRLAAKAGPAVIGVTFIRKAADREGMLRPVYSITSYEYSGDMSVVPHIQRVELRGPFDVTGPGQSPSRQRIFVCQPPDRKPSRDPAVRACARTILSQLAGRAYRRPVTAEDVNPLLTLYDRAQAEAGFDAGIEAALRRILVGPDFLFRIEADTANARAGESRRLSDVELASRLSFFLWSSIPDPTLLDLATRGQLRKPGVLDAQVRRMLADDRSRTLVTNFAGQWLYLRNLRLVSPDPYGFPDFDENLRLALEREVDLFLDSQIRGDRSLTELLTADYTFLNERLAKHYGIRNVYGSHFRRVTLTDPARKGLLGKAGVLTLTSYPNRTSPVLRGKWLLENLLGAPPPPPPPDVPALMEPKDGGQRLTVRQRMEQHRANPACASCHKAMDPLGFALENFDAVGRWRDTTEAGTPIDAAATLADGTPVDGPAALNRALLAHRDEFIRTVTEKLLVYALGRGLEPYDAPTVRTIMRSASQSGDRWSSLILGIVKSLPFQARLAAPHTDPPAQSASAQNGARD